MKVIYTQTARERAEEIMCEVDSRIVELGAKRTPEIATTFLLARIIALLERMGFPGSEPL